MMLIHCFYLSLIPLTVNNYSFDQSLKPCARFSTLSAVDSPFITPFAATARETSIFDDHGHRFQWSICRGLDNLKHTRRYRVCFRELCVSLLIAPFSLFV